MVDVILALVYLPTKSADDVFAEIYLINTASKVCRVRTQGDFWLTVDDASGQAVKHGSSAIEHELKPKQAAKAGNILGWELDSALGFDVWLQKFGEKSWTHRAYNLKGGGKEELLPVIKKKGVIRKPIFEKTE